MRYQRHLYLAQYVIDNGMVSLSSCAALSRGKLYSCAVTTGKSPYTIRYGDAYNAYRSVFSWDSNHYKYLDCIDKETDSRKMKCSFAYIFTSLFDFAISQAFCYQQGSLAS